MTLTEQLQAHATLHRNLQSNLGHVLEDVMPGAIDRGEFASDEYELGMDVGAVEVLRYCIPLLAECVDGNPIADERLRVLLSDLRSARRAIVGDDEEIAA